MVREEREILLLMHREVSLSSCSVETKGDRILIILYVLQIPQSMLLTYKFSTSTANGDVPLPYYSGNRRRVLHVEQMTKSFQEICLQVFPILYSDAHPQYPPINGLIAHASPFNQAFHPS